MKTVTAITYDSVWKDHSDLWILINPDDNPWTGALDWSLNLLLRRTLLRLENKAGSGREPVLLAAPLGLPSPRILVLLDEKVDATDWIDGIEPLLGLDEKKSKGRDKSREMVATVFAPSDWSLSAVKRKLGLNCAVRWVEAGG